MEVYFELNYDDENDDDDDDEGDIEKVKRLFQVPNIVRRLADADNLPCRIGHYFVMIMMLTMTMTMMM